MQGEGCRFESGLVHNRGGSYVSTVRSDAAPIALTTEAIPVVLGRLAQMAERHSYKVHVGGSIPSASTMKPCGRCSALHGGQHSWCKPCRAEYDKENYQKNRERRREQTKYLRQSNVRKLHEYKEAHPCADCGNHFPAVCMDFDHTGSDKEANVADLVTRRSWERLQEELAKCELVCANCHRIRTALRGQV